MYYINLNVILERSVFKELPPLAAVKSEPSISQQQQQFNYLPTTNSNTSTSYFDSISNEYITTKDPLEQPLMTGLSPQNPFSPLVRSLPQSPIQDPFASPFVNNDNIFTQPFSAPISPAHTPNINRRPGRSDSNPFRALSNPNILTSYQNPLVRSATSPDFTTNFQDPIITGYFKDKAQTFNPFSPVTPPIAPNQAFPPQMKMPNQQQHNTASHHHSNPFNKTVQHTPSI
jgi:hypothetical protein